MNSFAYSSCRATNQPTAFMFNDSGLAGEGREGVGGGGEESSGFQLVKQPFSPVAGRLAREEGRVGASKLHCSGRR